MTVELRVENLTKRFGDLTAVDDISFTVTSGHIYGFIGPNGAGKTTTMRIISTLDLPDEGDVWIDGSSVLEQPRLARERLGFMPDAYGAYPNTTVRDYLDFYARAYGLRGRERIDRIAYLSDFTGLRPLEHKEMGSLSKGMKQRLCLAKTLLHDPGVLVLDEPAAGLDPRARIELRELVRALADMGKAVLISSHILAELSEMCHGVAVIEKGTIRASGKVDDIARGLTAHVVVYVKTLAGPEATERALLELPGTSEVRPEHGGVEFQFDGGNDELAGLLATLVERGLQPVEFAPRITDLEDVFLTLTDGEVQ